MNSLKNRIGLCGAWSFDNSEGKCYLHTVDGCCGQFGKKEANLDWISGYVCRQCWSTLSGTDCPCSIQDRAWRPKTKHEADETPPSALAVKLKDQHQRKLYFILILTINALIWGNFNFEKKIG